MSYVLCRSSYQPHKMNESFKESFLVMQDTRHNKQQATTRVPRYVVVYDFSMYTIVNFHSITWVDLGIAYLLSLITHHSSTHIINHPITPKKVLCSSSFCVVSRYLPQQVYHIICHCAKQHSLLTHRTSSLSLSNSTYCLKYG